MGPKKKQNEAVDANKEAAKWSANETECLVHKLVEHKVKDQRLLKKKYTEANK